AGVKIRSRALITTMFIRLTLADLFIHGIGGAKYDEVTDLICQRFFGSLPPAFAAMSGTLRLPIQRPRDASPAARQLRDELRDLPYHPERKLAFLAATNGERAAAEAVATEKSRWVAAQKRPENARERHQAIASANAALQPFLASYRKGL